MAERVRGEDERRLAVGASAVLAVLAVPTVAVALLLVGPAGAVSALIGLGFVWLLFGASALVLAAVARRPGADPVMPLVMGALLRLPIYLVVLNLLAPLPWVHGRSLAAATGLGVAVTLAWELWSLSRMPRLFWVEPAAAPAPAGLADLAHGTRSRSL